MAISQGGQDASLAGNSPKTIGVGKERKSALTAGEKADLLGFSSRVLADLPDGGVVEISLLDLEGAKNFTKKKK